MQRSSTRLWLWAIVPGYLVLHGIVATCLPAWLDPLSTFLIVLAEWGAIAAALLSSKNAVYPVKLLWRLLAASIAIHSIAMSLDMATEITQAPIFNHVPGFSVFFSMLSGVPLLVAVSMPTERRLLGIARAVSSLFSFAIGLLLYLEIFSLLTISGNRDPAVALLIAHLFEAIDVFLAIAATLRWVGSNRPRESSFFRILSILLWLNTVLPAIHNRIMLYRDDVWLDLFISGPYVCLVVLIWTAPPRPPPPFPPALVRAVRTGSPIFQTMALVAVGVIESRSHLYAGLAVVLLAIGGYGAMNVFAQSRGLESEDFLLAAKLRLERLVDVDSLTGIANRGAFDRALEREFAASRRTKLPVSLLMIDIDYFKEVNDLIDHQAGDDILILLSEAMRMALPRATDFVARYGGDEFSVILPATGLVGATKAAEKIHEGIADLGLRRKSTPSEAVTISIGISTFDGLTTLSPPSLVKVADRALYLAKRGGRNRTEFLLPDGE